VTLSAYVVILTSPMTSHAPTGNADVKSPRSDVHGTRRRTGGRRHRFRYHVTWLLLLQDSLPARPATSTHYACAGITNTHRITNRPLRPAANYENQIQRRTPGLGLLLQPQGGCMLWYRLNRIIRQLLSVEFEFELSINISPDFCVILRLHRDLSKVFRPTHTKYSI